MRSGSATIDSNKRPYIFHTYMRVRNMNMMSYMCTYYVYICMMCSKSSKTYQSVAVCCSVWRCMAVCCSVLQCAAACCNVLHTAACCMILQHTLTHHHVVVDGLHSDTHCNTLRHVVA